MVSTFTDLFNYLNSLDVLISLLPFILIFTVVFAILQKAEIFGPGKKNINIVIALVMGLAVVLPHIIYGTSGSTYMYVNGVQVPDAVNVINGALPQVSIVVIAILMVMLMLGLFGFRASWVGGIQGWMVLISLVLVLYIFGNSAGFWNFPDMFSFLADSGLQTALIVILIFGIIIFIVTREEGQGITAGNVGKGMGDVFNSLFGGQSK